jgi:hypothetical protein
MSAEWDVDVVILCRDHSPLPHVVRRGLDSHTGVRLTPHRVIGTPLPSDSGRWETIARARNAGKSLGRSPWLMFLDDDVRLAPDAIDRLRRGLLANPLFGALAADYLGEAVGDCSTPHVAMGATLFRRSALDRIHFRWSRDRCECQCCCDDLRRQGIGIRYEPEARAWHLTTTREHPQSEREARHTTAPGGSVLPGRILTAFDRRHYDKFRRRFLRSLRDHGNQETVSVVGYGLYPSERAVLSALPGVEVYSLPLTGVMPPLRRLQDFQTVLERWPADTPAAYWDAGDVVFQSELKALWDTVRAHPDRLLAVREPTGHPRNPAVAAWTLSITDAVARERAFRLFSQRPFLNSGFAAGTARTLLAYLREALRLLRSPALRGTSDWGDQTALNLYCHLNPEAWHEVEEGWNYCVHARRAGELRVGPDGRVISARGTPIHAVHGNAHSLRRLELFWV